MTQPLSQKQLDHLLKFVGYGSLNADVWFLGMEEAGGGEANIRTRLKLRTVEDCAEAHRMLGVTKLHWGKRVIQRTWRGMCYIMLRLDHREPTRSNIRQYQAECLGRSHGKTLLTELMPIPKPKMNEWGYEKLIPQFSSAREYYRAVKPQRVGYLQQLITTNKPKVIIGYGKGFWSAYRELFDGHRFVQDGQFEVAMNETTLLILTPHFTARTMNGKFDDVVSIIREHRAL